MARIDSPASYRERTSAADGAAGGRRIPADFRETLEVRSRGGDDRGGFDAQFPVPLDLRPVADRLAGVEVVADLVFDQEDPPRSGESNVGLPAVSDPVRPCLGLAGTRVGHVRRTPPRTRLAGPCEQLEPAAQLVLRHRDRLGARSFVRPERHRPPL